MTTPQRFTEEQDARLLQWFELGCPGQPHDWLGMSKAEYDDVRAWLQEWARQRVASPTARRLFAISHARRVADFLRWEDDGGPPLPDEFVETREFRNAHLRNNYVSTRLT